MVTATEGSLAAEFKTSAVVTEESPVFVVTASAAPTSSFRVGVPMDMLICAREAILSLLDNLDFLGYQLALANGCMDQSQFDELAERYLATHQRSDEDLARMAAFLAVLVPNRFDAELVSMAF